MRQNWSPQSLITLLVKVSTKWEGCLEDGLKNRVVDEKARLFIRESG